MQQTIPLSLISPFFECMIIDELTDDTRSINALKRAGIFNFAELIERWDDIDKIRNLGAKSFKLIRNALVEKYYQSLDVNGKARFIADFIKLNTPQTA